MPQSAMGPDLLESLEVVPHLLVDLVGKDVGELAVDEIFLPVEEPVGDFKLRWVLHDGDDPLELVRIEFSSAMEYQLGPLLRNLKGSR